MLLNTLLLQTISATSVVNAFLLLFCPVLMWDILHMQAPEEKGASPKERQTDRMAGNQQQVP